MAAPRFQEILKRWRRPGKAAETVEELLRWDARLAVDSRAALLYEVWMSKLPAAVFGPSLGARVDLATVLTTLEAAPHEEALAE